MNYDKMELFYFQTTDIWQRFCDEHYKIFDLTCLEYNALLKSDLDELDYIVSQKKAVIKYVEQLDTIRSELIEQINNEIDEDLKISNVSDLIAFMSIYEENRQFQHLSNYNLFLIDIIEKIQNQNQDNQVFIKKALQSIKDIKGDLLGTKKYSTYTSKGISHNRAL